MNFVQTRVLTSSGNKEVRRFAKFATVGVAGALMHFTLLNVLVQVARFPTSLANPIGFTVAVLQNFALNRRWTYPESRERNAFGQLGQFAVVSLIGLGINQTIFVTVQRWLEPHLISWAGQQHLGHLLSYNFAWAIATGIVMFWNFGINRLWTYRGF